MKNLRILAISVCIGLGAIIALGIPLHAQLTGAPIPFSADWADYIEGELQDSGRFYATPEAVRIETGREKLEEGVSFTTIWDYRKMVVHVLEDWHQKYFSSIIQPRQAGKDDFGEFGVPCPNWLGEPEATPIGSNTLHGRETENWKCLFPGGETMTAWYDTRLQRTIRYEFNSKDYLEMTNIKEGPQRESLFVLPPDYSRL